MEFGIILYVVGGTEQRTYLSSIAEKRALVLVNGYENGLDPGIVFS
jgi:hypothetical protein